MGASSKPRKIRSQTTASCRLRPSVQPERFPRRRTKRQQKQDQGLFGCPDNQLSNAISQSLGRSECPNMQPADAALCARPRGQAEQLRGPGLGPGRKLARKPGSQLVPGIELGKEGNSLARDAAPCRGRLEKCWRRQDANKPRG